VLTASPQNWTGAWESIIIARAFSVMVRIILSVTSFCGESKAGTVHMLYRW